MSKQVFSVFFLTVVRLFVSKLKNSVTSVVSWRWRMAMKWLRAHLIAVSLFATTRSLISTRGLKQPRCLFLISKAILLLCGRFGRCRCGIGCSLWGRELVSVMNCPCRCWLGPGTLAI